MPDTGSAVTGREGDHWNSNDGGGKLFYEEHGHGVGVGQINWNDPSKRDALRKNLTYLAKAEQYVMLKVTENMRTFDMGRVPRKGRAGRPRLDPDTRVAAGMELAVETLFA
ncbi:hypothetical protein ACNRDB_14595 [Ralstonia pseudosolanacearum]|nr:hypothetical protein [Ralstonia pseudosolanacearum]